MTSLTASRIDALLKHIDIALKDVGDKSLEEFKESDLLVRATCFSVIQVGEHMGRLEKKIGNQYPDLPWSKAIGLRNLIVHVYNHVKAEIVYETVKNDLPELKIAFEKIRAENPVKD